MDLLASPLIVWLWLSLTVKFCWANKLRLSNIDPNGFEQRAASPGVFVMAFCVDWFEPCKALHSELLHASEGLGKTSEVSVYEVDCLEHTTFCASLDVLSFPTIRIFDHQEWSRYRGLQKSSAIVTHVLKRVMEPLVEIDNQNLAVMNSLDLPLMLLSCGQNDESNINLLASIAEKELSQRFFVGIASDPATVSIDRETSPSVKVFNTLDVTVPQYNGPLERNALLEFADLVSEPLVREFDLSAMVSFMKSGLPIAMIYSAQEEERISIAQRLSGVAMKYRREINFAIVDAIKNKFSLEPLDLKLDQLPAFVIQTDNGVFKLGLNSAVGPEVIDDFIQKKLYPQNFMVAYPTS